MADNKNSLALLIAAVMAIVVGASFLYIGFFTTATVSNTADATLTPSSASSTFTISNGNVTNGSTVNISNAAGVITLFEFNKIGGGYATAGRVNVSFTPMNALNASSNLTNKINTNASVNGTWTATNPTNTTVLITSKRTGSAYNLPVSTNDVNASWSSSTALNGVDGYAGWEGMQTSVNTGFLLTGILIMLVGVIGLISMLYSGFGISSIRR